MRQDSLIQAEFVHYVFNSLSYFFPDQLIKIHLLFIYFSMRNVKYLFYE